MKALHKLHNNPATEYGGLVQNLNEECAILCDLIPSYKISATLEAEDGGGGQRKKKEVYRVQQLEHEVLTQYEHFLQLLRKLSRKSHPEQQALGSRLCSTLVASSSAPEFNHSETLLELAVEFANSKSTRVAQPALKALGDLLDGQMVSKSTECVVAALLNIVRKRSYAVNPRLLTILLHVRVAMVDIHRSDVTEEKAKNKRLKKEDKELARQMQKANARRDRAELAAQQTRIIHRIFVIYLRILEASRGCPPVHQSKILAPTLEGLVKFAPLINLELYHQLMQALKDLANQESARVMTKLHALVVVATLAQKDATMSGSDWRVDLSYFLEVLFRCLPEALRLPDAEPSQRMSHEAGGLYDQPDDDGSGTLGGDADETASVGSTASTGSLSSQAFSVANSMAQGNFVKSSASKEWSFNVGLVLRAVDLLILTQKHLPIARVTAILRRLMHTLPSCPPHAALALLALCHRIVVRYPLAGGVIMGGADHVMSGRGAYQPDALQTTSSNADGSFTWELSLLARSYHPTLRQVVQTFAQHFVKLAKQQPGQMSVMTRQLDALGPYEVLAEYDPSSGEIRPAAPLPKSSVTRPAPTTEEEVRSESSRKRPRHGSREDRHRANPAAIAAVAAQG